MHATINWILIDLLNIEFNSIQRCIEQRPDTYNFDKNVQYSLKLHQLALDMHVVKAYIQILERVDESSIVPPLFKH